MEWNINGVAVRGTFDEFRQWQEYDTPRPTAPHPVPAAHQEHTEQVTRKTEAPNTGNVTREAAFFRAALMVMAKHPEGKKWTAFKLRQKVKRAAPAVLISEVDMRKSAEYMPLGILRETKKQNDGRIYMWFWIAPKLGAINRKDAPTKKAHKRAVMPERLINRIKWVHKRAAYIMRKNGKTRSDAHKQAHAEFKTLLSHGIFPDGEINAPPEMVDTQLKKMGV